MSVCWTITWPITGRAHHICLLVWLAKLTSSCITTFCDLPCLVTGATITTWWAEICLLPLSATPYSLSFLPRPYSSLPTPLCLPFSSPCLFPLSPSLSPPPLACSSLLWMDLFCGKALGSPIRIGKSTILDLVLSEIKWNFPYEYSIWLSSVKAWAKHFPQTSWVEDKEHIGQMRHGWENHERWRRRWLFNMSTRMRKTTIRKKSPWLPIGQSLESVAAEKGSWHNQWWRSPSSPNPSLRASYPGCGKAATEPSTWLLCQCLFEWYLCGICDQEPVKSGCVGLPSCRGSHLWMSGGSNASVDSVQLSSWGVLLTYDQVQKNSRKHTFSWVRRWGWRIAPSAREQRGIKWAFWHLPDPVWFLKSFQVHHIKG